METIDIFQKIRLWAAEKGIYEKGDIKTQTLKLQEEVGELAKAVLDQEVPGIVDAVGDCVVVLTSIAHFNGIKIEDCINVAYMEIINRKGKMENGDFKKDE